MTGPRRHMDIVSAMADPNLFGRSFRGPSWDG
jgi:hypothetical protein